METLENKIKRLKADIIREDGRLERTCKHGCCGCCSEYEIDKT